MSDEKTIIASDFTQTIFAQGSKNLACFVQYNGADIGKRYILDEAEMAIGRSQKAKIVINEATVSNSHARISFRNTEVDLEDLGSTNGTFVNDKRITKATLRDGDMIRLGTVLLKFFAHGNVENVFHDKIYKKATIDQTTQVFNKQYLMECLESEFKISRNYGRKLSLIVYDLDFFKKVNDTYGHNAGDLILKESAQLVKSIVRKNDVLARFGGEEFVIILPDTDERTALDLAERIRKKVEANKFMLAPDKGIRQTISLGVSQLSNSMKTSAELMESADKKLYESKRTGRNRVTA